MSEKSSDTRAATLIRTAHHSLLTLQHTLDAVSPHVERTWAVGVRQYKRYIAPYCPEEAAALVVGLVLLLYGGQFPVCVAAVEAYRVCGWESTKDALVVLYEQYKIAMAAYMKDDRVDENDDGVPDVEQIRSRQLLTRKLGVFMRSTDPVAMNKAARAIAAGFSGVLASLRLRFAQMVTLGMALGDVFTEAAEKSVTPFLEEVIPKEYHKWISIGVSYACRSLAVGVAWWCQRIISTVHSATRGAHLILRAATQLLKRNNIQVPIDISPKGSLFPPACALIAALGFWSQVMRGFALTFPLNVLLLPVRIVEWLMAFAVTFVD